MNTTRVVLAVLVLFFGAPRAPAGLARGIQSVLTDALARSAAVGVLVESVESGEVLYEHCPDSLFAPASNMKIITGAAALSILGPDYRFVTEVAIDAASADTLIAGDIYVRGSGDPSLVSEELWKLVEEIEVLGVKRIEGDLVLDDSYFDDVRTTSEGIADGYHAYEARTGALSLNFNAIAVHVRPGPRPGLPARVALAPATDFVELRSVARTVSSGTRSSIGVERFTQRGRNVVAVTGAISVGSQRTVVYRNLDMPAGYLGTVMAEFLGRAGVVLSGSIRTGLAPDHAAVIVRHESKPLSLIIRDLNKYSNNFIAEQLVKTLSAEVSGAPGTTQGGLAVLEEWLGDIGIDSLGYRLVDGSGFSRDNQLSPRTVVRAIRAALADFRVSYEFISSLSVSGSDGTLEDRMASSALVQNVRAKTGLLDGVTAISGIMRNTSGKDIVFSVMINGFRGKAWEAHRMEERILTAIARG